MIHKLLRFLVLCLLVSGSVYPVDNDFIKSFVVHYDFSPEGRYTHEYHPFLLQKTRASLELFEKHLEKSGFGLKGRVVIMGYQQEGVASYYSSLNARSLTDEASLSSKKGRVVPAHNIFGFLTGFLLKDANFFQKKWGIDNPLLIEHILPERVDLFDDYAYIFQKHAFGKDFDSILGYRDRVERSLKKKNTAGTLQELVNFWQGAYKGELKSCGQELLATQDILFSIDYGKHLIASSIPVSKMYIGPDITYPIEILSFQEQSVTECAQYFVQKFTANLKPVEGKKTAYVFCSFVDGVGKSTLLGNVINWVTYKNDVAAYQRVDNSSSQKGVLYRLQDDVFIMDLPAQLSHWVSKPDGKVFVDSQCISEISFAMQEQMKVYVSENKEKLQEQFLKDCTACKEGKVVSDTDLQMYLENVALFSSSESWIPFTYEQKLCVFNGAAPSEIRVLVPLEGVHSKGLKVAQPEQMLFTQGIKVPLKFESFMDDVVAQFSQAGIENLVFVDFLSMYPRSSRENVRVNFVLQQAKKLYGSMYDADMSLYRTFVNKDVELYHLLGKYTQNFTVSLLLEAAVRASLYTLFTEKSSETLTCLTVPEVTEYLKKETELYLKTSFRSLYSLVSQKIDSERKILEKYALDSTYEIYVTFCPEPLVAFSQFMENLFQYHVGHPYFSHLWQATDGQVVDQETFTKAKFQKKTMQKASLLLDGSVKQGESTQLTTGISMRCLDSFSYACRDSVTLSAVFPVIRSHWYMALANLITCEEVSSGRFKVAEPTYCVAPLVVKQYKNTIVVLQKQLSMYEDAIPMATKKPLHMFNNETIYKQDMVWGEFNGLPHCIEWQGTNTAWGLYSFGYDWKSPVYVKKIIEHECFKKIKAGYENPVLFSSQLAEIIEYQQLWQKCGTTQQGFAHSQKQSASKQKKIKVDSPRGRAIALWVRAIATLEMIVKDPKASVVTRKGVREDFAATLQLLERITLPRYFGVELDKSLFADYYLVEPVVSWQVLEK